LLANFERKMENEIKGAISYFSYFSYPPTSQEIYTFLKKKTSAGHFTSILEKMVKKSAIKICKTIHNSEFIIQNSKRYTLGEYGIGKFRIRNSKFKIANYALRERISKKKIKKIDRYVNLLSMFPQIKLIGLSGSVAMHNAEKDHDVDLFIITARNRLWTARFISVFLAQFMGIKRKRNVPRSTFYVPRFFTDKVCLNLFFDEARMDVPKYKRTEYVAHEILQMRPLVNKNSVYEAFLEQNKWVYKIFPNAGINNKSQISNLKSMSNVKNQRSNFFGYFIERLLKVLQLNIIKLHQTTEIVTDTQLWFHPDDFGKKILLNRT